LNYGFSDLAFIESNRQGEIGFLFQTASKFEKGAKKFLNQHPAVNKELINFLREQRAEWQSILGHIRNDYLEHRKIGWDHVRFFYCIPRAEMFFESAWNTASDILTVLIVSKFPEVFGIVEIPEAQRNPEYPNRFEFILKLPLAPS
jgi:hypothetical protein